HTAKANPWMVGDLEDRNGRDHGLRGGMTFTEGDIGRRMNVAENNLGRKGELERANPHPATYPWQLAEWSGRLITPPGDTIHAPFHGSASTGVAALRNGWNYLGIDAVPEDIELSGRRLDHQAGK